MLSFKPVSSQGSLSCLPVSFLLQLYTCHTYICDPKLAQGAA